MQLIFSDQDIPHNVTKSMFLAGPSPRDKLTIDWRIEALSYLLEIQYDGTVFIPIPKERFYGGNDQENWTYDFQIEWECKFRSIADIILFWVPRDIQNKMPAFTTNVEFGEDLSSGKIVYGRPSYAEKCRYLDNRCTESNIPIHTDLKDTLMYAVETLKDGAYREKGEIYIPLFIWKSSQFQSWYTNVKKAGNELINAKILHQYSIKTFLFSYILSCNIWIEKEQRYKNNEFVFARPNISAVLAYYKRPSDQTLEILLVKEFRSAVNNDEGYVYELPSGSNNDQTINAKVNAQHELSEETGLEINDINRFVYVGTRQLVATLSSHLAKLYKIELNDDEYVQLKNNIKNNVTFGVKSEQEITTVELVTIEQLSSKNVDFSVLGMIFNSLYL